LLLVMALFMAVRRLRSFIPDAGRRVGQHGRNAAGASPVAKDSGVGTLCTMPAEDLGLPPHPRSAESSHGKHLRR
jgi:hypothetical protein